ncbi:MAG TPA: hypothetical protein VH105_16610, partial [Burkholderiales bacterium]|nr:hypothetical protein [Burkholderiales bacterium]
MRKLLALLLILTIVLPLAACDFVRPFEEVCERKLGPASISVEVAPVQFETDFSQSSAQLTARGAHAAGRIVLGLTETQLKSAISFSGNGVVKPITGRYCMRPAVAVKLAFDPMKLFVASEQKPGGCEHKITLDHERRHMGVYARYLDTLAAHIEQDLKQKFGDRIMVFPSTADAETQVRSITADTLKPYMEKGMSEVQELQKAVDSP